MNALPQPSGDALLPRLQEMVIGALAPHLHSVEGAVRELRLIPPRDPVPAGKREPLPPQRVA